MSDEIIDIDELIGARKRLKINDEVYELPGDIPIDAFLELIAMEQRTEDDDVTEAEVLQELQAKISELFLLCDPEFVWPPELGVKTTMQLVGRVYRNAAAADEAAADVADPTPAAKATRGATTSSPPKPARKRPRPKAPSSPAKPAPSAS